MPEPGPKSLEARARITRLNEGQPLPFRPAGMVAHAWWRLLAVVRGCLASTGTQWLRDRDQVSIAQTSFRVP
jgi:hypothetical protein